MIYRRWLARALPGFEGRPGIARQPGASKRI
jgi:hypothetical protein